MTTNEKMVPRGNEVNDKSQGNEQRSLLGSVNAGLLPFMDMPAKVQL